MRDGGQVAPTRTALVGYGHIAHYHARALKKSESAELVNKQVRPVRGTGKQRVEFNGISRELETGDEVGLMVYGFHPQYLASFSTIPGVLDITGEIGLPIVDLSASR